MELYNICECGQGVKLDNNDKETKTHFCPQCGETVADIADVEQKIKLSQTGMVND